MFILVIAAFFLERIQMQKLSEYLPSMKLDGYSFELCQECVDKWERQSDNQGKWGFHHTLKWVTYQ